MPKKKDEKEISCPPGISSIHIRKVANRMGWKKGQGRARWMKVFAKAAHEWQEMTPSQRNRKYDKSCRRPDKVTKKKRSSSKRKTPRRPISTVRKGWVRDHCGDEAATIMGKRKRVGRKWLDDYCPDDEAQAAYKKLVARRKKRKNIGGCGCEMCKKMGNVGGCACLRINGGSCKWPY